MDAKTRQVMAFHVGDRSRKSTKRLWAKIPQAYRQHATFDTDQYVVYDGVIPATQHKAISKLARKTNWVCAMFGEAKGNDITANPHSTRSSPGFLLPLWFTGFHLVTVISLPVIPRK